MAKYDALAKMLRSQSASQVRLTFEQVAAVVPGGLPPSAYNHQAWWANEQHGSHVHARAWLNEGWRVESFDLRRRVVTFATTASEQRS